MTEEEIEKVLNAIQARAEKNDTPLLTELVEQMNFLAWQLVCQGGFQFGSTSYPDEDPGDRVRNRHLVQALCWLHTGTGTEEAGGGVVVFGTGNTTNAASYDLRDALMVADKDELLRTKAH